jgi:hypothetical protein
MNTDNYFIYKGPTNNPIILRRNVSVDVLGEGYEFMEERSDHPGLSGGETWVNGAWVAPAVPYGEARQYSYPALGDQLDALWHAMDRGDLPKILGFYDPIKQVKDENPK